MRLRDALGSSGGMSRLGVVYTALDPPSLKTNHINHNDAPAALWTSVSFVSAETLAIENYRWI